MSRPKRYCYADDCGKQVQGHGLCSKHYQRWKRYGRLHLLANQPTRQAIRYPLPPQHDRREWIIWAAGFFDGEGCVYIQHRKNTNVYFLKATVVQKDLEPLNILQALFGGSVNKRRTAPGMWSVSTRMAEKALRELMPFLLVKRKEAELALSFQSRMGRAFFNGLSKTEVAAREAIKKQLSALNQL